MRENKRKKEVEGGREKHDENAGDFIGTFSRPTRTHSQSFNHNIFGWGGGGLPPVKYILLPALCSSGPFFLFLTVITPSLVGCFLSIERAVENLLIWFFKCECISLSLWFLITWQCLFIHHTLPVHFLLILDFFLFTWRQWRVSFSSLSLF